MKNWTFFFAMSLSQISLAALDLEGFLGQVRERHQGFKSLDASRGAAEDRQVAGDISLVPTLSLRGGWMSDKKQPNFLGAENTETTQYSLGLNKKFSTGTLLNLSASALGSESKGLANPLLADYAKYAQGSLGFAVSQSLWKDFFGLSTRLRRERESIVARSEKSSYNLQAQQILVDAEQAFWDYMYLQAESELRTLSLKRSQKIESWVRRRVGDGIGNRADLLNSQALVATRELQLIMIQDELVANQKKIRNVLELPEAQPIPELKGTLDGARDVRKKFATGQRIVRLDAYLSLLEAKTKAVVARETAENYKSDFVLAGGYNTNSYEPGGTVRDATKNWQNKETPTSSVSVTWTYMFDTSVKDAAVSGAKKDAVASDLMSQRKLLESDLAWTELLRRHEELSKKIAAARVISRLQMDRAKAEQDQLSRGRAITTDVINSEQDAAEGELSLSKLLTEQRKLESQSALFVSAEDL